MKTFFEVVGLIGAAVLAHSGVPLWFLIPSYSVWVFGTGVAFDSGSKEGK